MAAAVLSVDLSYYAGDDDFATFRVALPRRWREKATVQHLIDGLDRVEADDASSTRVEGSCYIALERLDFSRNAPPAQASRTSSRAQGLSAAYAARCSSSRRAASRSTRARPWRTPSGTARSSWWPPRAPR